jgi:hypothetical protein
MKPKWRWIENKCSQIWLQAKYERNFRGGKKKQGMIPTRRFSQIWLWAKNESKILNKNPSLF